MRDPTGYMNIIRIYDKTIHDTKENIEELKAALDVLQNPILPYDWLPKVYPGFRAWVSIKHGDMVSPKEGHSYLLLTQRNRDERFYQYDVRPWHSFVTDEGWPYSIEGHKRGVIAYAESI
jgi:hypothetical protein